MTAADGAREDYRFVLCGVGGQGIILAADVLALVGLALGLDVKKSEVHGMAQRGGSVVSHVRWAPRVHSPLIGPGEADYLLAFERLEALRYAPLLRPGGVCLVNDYRIAPVTVSAGDAAYPSAAEEATVWRRAGTVVRYVPAMRLAQELGQGRVNNVVMLGALAATLEASRGGEGAIWEEVIARRVPQRYLELNRAAFAAGRAYAPAEGQPA